MTPKEKAEQLVQQIIDTRNIKLSDYSIIYHPTAKKIAIKMVNEILNEIPLLDYHPSGSYTNPRIEYWKEVKEEIEKI